MVSAQKLADIGAGLAVIGISAKILSNLSKPLTKKKVKQGKTKEINFLS